MNLHCLELKNVSKKVGKTEILRNISLEVRRGEIMGLLGPNGAGKTTLMRLIVQLSKLSKGNIYIDGLDVTEHFEQAMQKVGVIIESPHLYPFMTGTQNLAYFSKLGKRQVSEQRIRELVEMVGLRNGINKKVKNYSLGMKQRLGLAQALLHSPSLLILDEPMNGLDPEGMVDLRNLLRNLAKQGVTILVSSHLLIEMQSLCDRVAFIQEGRLIKLENITHSSVRSRLKKIIFQVDRADAAQSCLHNYKSAVVSEVSDTSLAVTLDPEHVPDVIERLVFHQVKIYDMYKEKENLEEMYLEIAKGGGR